MGWPIISLDGFFAWLWRASWQASVVVVLVWAAQELLGRRLAPRWRHALWFLVIVRTALPWSLESPVSVFNWFGPKPEARLTAPPAAGLDDGPPAGESTAAAPERASPPGRLNVAKRGLGGVWLCGAAGLTVYLLGSNWRLVRLVRRQRPVTDTSVLNLLEDCKLEMGVSTPLSLVETTAVRSPALLGFVRPRLLLPSGLTRGLSLEELRYVLLHELGHLKRGDILLTWTTTFLLVLHWFNPLLWLAFRQMRVDGELACDALALSHAREGENRSYGQTILKLVEHFSRPALGPGLAGILENNNQMKRRLNMIVKFKSTRTWPAMAAILFAALGVATLTDAQTGKADNGAPDPGGPPRIVATSPEVGKTEVDPSVSEITVTFDRDMAGGFSWTGSGPDYPPTPEGKKPLWRNKRTCVLPVKLESGRYYRVGINSTSFQNFKSAEGVPARPSAIYFATQGATGEVKRRATKPLIVGLTPRNGATDVDPNLTELRVTFNVPMGGGCSWTGGGPEFPTIPEGKKSQWSEDKKTCILPVKLTPGTQYRLGLNSPSHKNFQSLGGVPLDPVSYSFKTRD